MESAMLTTIYCSVALPWPPGEPRQVDGSLLIQA